MIKMNVPRKHIDSFPDEFLGVQIEYFNGMLDLSLGKVWLTLF